MFVYGKCECFVMQMLHVLCESCCVLHDLQFVNAGQGCKRQPYGRTYSRAGLMTALYVVMSVSFCLPHPVAVSVFIICIGLWACTEML